MHSPALTVDPSGPSREDIAAYFAMRRHDKTWKHAYSNLSPDDTDACVALAMNGQWRPYLERFYGNIVAGHHLHDRDYVQGTTWCSGWIHPDVRGPRHHNIRCDMWSAVRRAIEGDGFTSIFCYSLVQNPAAGHWIRTACGFTEVSAMHHAVPENDGMIDIVLFTQREEDRDQCLGQALYLFPEGELATDT